jgi:hypothetical protein
LAVRELYSFLEWHGFKKGIVLLDNNEAINWIIFNKSRKLGCLHQSLISIDVKLQYIPRRYNIAHSIAHSNRYVPSRNILSIDRDHLSGLINYPDYELDLAVFEEFRKSQPKKTRSFHQYQRSLNKKIWLGDLIEEEEEYKLYAYYDLRIKVLDTIIVSVTKEHYVNLLNHYRIIRKKKKLSRLKRKSINSSTVSI